MKECVDNTSKCLVFIFDVSLEQGKIPEDWRCATFTPIYKGGNKNKSLPENYQPVSLTAGAFLKPRISDNKIKTDGKFKNFLHFGIS